MAEMAPARTATESIWASDRATVTVTRLDALKTTWLLRLATEYQAEVLEVEINQWQRDQLVAALGAPAAERCAGCDAHERTIEWFARELHDVRERWRPLRAIPPMCRRPKVGVDRG